MARAVGLRTEILTTLTLLMGAALLLGGVLMLRMTEQSLLEQRVSQVDALTKTLAMVLMEASADDSPDRIFSRSNQILQQLPEALNYTGWCLYDKNLQLDTSFNLSDSRLISVNRLRQLKHTKEPIRSVEFPSLLAIFGTPPANVRIAVPLLSMSRFAGVLEIHFSLDDIRQRLLLLQRMILIYVVLYGSVLIMIGYYLLQRNVIKPARNLLTATEEVGRGNLENRLPVAGPLEISRLAQAYNDMVEKLQESRQETQEHIGALERTNQDLQVAREELIRSEKLASVGQLAAGLAHELGNPLSALIGYLEILSGSLKTENDLDIVKRTQAEAERIDFLVRELLDFSRPGESRVELIDPAKELRTCLELLDNQGAFSAVKLDDQLPESLPPVRFNPQKFRQVFINLLLNATYACRDGGQIRVAGECQSGEVFLDIVDNGCGISAEILSKVFDPFFTTKPPGKGTGLGLAICHRLLGEMEGGINFQSQEGAGTCCRVTLKAAAG